MSSEGCMIDRKWIVLVVNFLNMFLCAGFPFNMSVLNVEFLRAFGKGKAQTALVQSVTTGMMDIAGFICGQCVNRYGVRRMGMCGGLLAFLGLASSFFATSIPYLIVSVGVVSGFGFSLAFVSSLTSVGEYFNGKAKLAAIAFIGTGSGCGAMLIPFMLNSLIDRFGWQGCLLIMGGLMGNMTCYFAICKPKIVGVKQPKVEICKFESSPIHKQVNKKDNRDTITNTCVFE
ncbi:monocarboxylate transporter 9-like [Mizuhopecten yessoensis]|uniref:Monocarboxylate transporter 9 n=1 Tax=Mizuhopecten yessoensis TaxID=6573 RepID=A0A210PSW0_MIZYE|nr:monocarboxylate transporter 9-like [Mizuhopecten yessoensis]OWF39573.1 Monocarboxylate transporter 9 [Mizuhopecten yessoensis]